MSIDLTKQVESRAGDLYEVLEVSLRDMNTNEVVAVKFDSFLLNYSEYVDPKDLEIERLKQIIKDLENGAKPKHTKTRLTDDEWLDVENDIRNGGRNIDIARTYGISDSSVSKKRIAMRKLGEKV